MNVLRELKKRSEEKRECWAYMLESLITSIKLDLVAKTSDAIHLMKVRFFPIFYIVLTISGIWSRNFILDRCVRGRGDSIDSSGNWRHISRHLLLVHAGRDTFFKSSST